jgi:hypothetical protein
MSFWLIGLAGRVRLFVSFFFLSLCWLRKVFPPDIAVFKHGLLLVCNTIFKSISYEIHCSGQHLNYGTSAIQLKHVILGVVSHVDAR